MSEAFALAAVTILSYLYAYFFEMGYAFRFSYPPELIGPTLSSLVGGWIIMLFVFLLGFLQLQLQFWPSSGRWKAAFVALLVIYIFAMLTIMAGAGTWLFAIAGVVSGAIAIFVNWKYRRSLIQDTEPRPEASESTHMSPDIKDTFTMYDSKSNIPRYSIAYALTKQFGRDPLAYFLIFLIIVPVICIYAGASRSIAMKDFYLITGDGSSHPELVVRIVNGVVISVPYDPTNQSFRTEYHVREVSDLGGYRISPLRIEKLVKTASP